MWLTFKDSSVCWNCRLFNYQDTGGDTSDKNILQKDTQTHERHCNCC